MDLVLFRISPNGSRLDYLNFMPRYIPISCGICDLFSSGISLSPIKVSLFVGILLLGCSALSSLMGCGA